MRTDLLDNVVVILDRPQDLVNVAAVIRAMKNMGLSRLRLVDPDEFDAYRIEGIAHRTEDLVESTQIMGSLEEAVKDAVWVVGTSARARTAQRNYVRPRQAAPVLLARAEDGPVALVFGREDRGLSNEALDLCHAVVIIPTNPDYPSLNLAQAFLVLAYELFLAAGGEGVELPRGKRATRPATADDMEETYAALRRGLDRIDFFKAREPEAVMRTLRTLVGRADPDLREARLVRAVGFEIANYLDRVEKGAGRSDGPSRPESEDS